jgi:hypothetical protein
MPRQSKDTVAVPLQRRSRLPCANCSWMRRNKLRGLVAPVDTGSGLSCERSYGKRYERDILTTRAEPSRLPIGGRPVTATAARAWPLNAGLRSATLCTGIGVMRIFKPCVSETTAGPLTA